MQPVVVFALSEAIFWILLILSAPLIGRYTYILTLPLWSKIFKTEYIRLTVTDGKKTLRVIVRREDDYLDELDDAIKRAGIGIEPIVDEEIKHY
jgi:hypothetical protein